LFFVAFLVLSRQATLPSTYSLNLVTYLFTLEKRSLW
jgi:hypothetical protein